MNRIYASALTVFLVLLMSATSVMAHQGHSNRAPWDACDELKVNEICEWTNNAHWRYIGTCRAIGDDLMCVRNKPIQKEQALQSLPKETTKDIAKTDAQGLVEKQNPWTGVALTTLLLIGAGFILKPKV